MMIVTENFDTFQSVFKSIHIYSSSNEYDCYHELTSYTDVYNFPEFWNRRLYIGRFSALML